MPTKPALPGASFLSVLRGQPQSRLAVFFEFENVRAVRTNGWKYVERFRQEPNELYDLRADAGELVNLVDKPEHADQREGLRDLLHAFFAKYADPQYDLWRGGRSKADLLSDALK